MSVEILDRIVFFFTLALVLTGIVDVLRQVPDKEKFFDQFTQQPLNSSKSMLGFVWSYNSLTPSIQNDWLEPKGEYTFILEDLPIPDPSDLVLLIPFMLVLAWILRQFESLNSGWGIFWSIIIILLGTVLFWVLIKNYQMHNLQNTASSLGLDVEQVLKSRYEVKNETFNYTPIYVLIFVFFLISIFKTLTGIWRQDK